MDSLTLLLEYAYMPLGAAMYYLHIKHIRLDTKVQDYLDFKNEIYTTLNDIKRDVHYLIETKKDRQNEAK